MEERQLERCKWCRHGKWKYEACPYCVGWIDRELDSHYYKREILGYAQFDRAEHEATLERIQWLIEPSHDDW